MKNTKTNLLHSVIALMLCLSMLLSTTVAWFTDTAESVGNIITSGELKAEMHWADSLEGSWTDASTGAIFNEKNWEPGKSTMKFIKISNVGDMAFLYQLGIVPNFTPAAGQPNLASVIDVYYGIVGEGFQAPTAFSETMPGMTQLGTLAALMADPNGAAQGILLPEAGRGAADKQLPAGVTADTGAVTVCLMLHMQETAGNEYQNIDVGGGFSVQLLATQYSYENDSFGNTFDENALFPLLELPATAAAPVTPTAENTVPAGGVTISMGQFVSAVVPEGAAVVPGTTELKLTISDVEETESNVTLGDTEIMRSLDIHVHGLAEDNTVPVQVHIARALPTGLNLGNYSFYHVEDGVTNPMTLIGSVAELTAHNQFTYDPITGDVVLNMASFSEVAVVAEPSVWEGGIAEAFSGGSGTEADPYLIANADQLAHMNELISNGDVEYAKASYKLIWDINFAGESKTTATNVWYPIGYHKVGGTGGNGAATEEIWYTGGDVAFSGVFDGNGNTISGIYQNTWIMNGDYDAGYWDAAMGLFGWVKNATIKNLTIDSFVSEGEFTPTGCVATYAGGKSTFENIAITNSNPATYNTAVAGVVGLNASSSGEGEELIFRNVTVDESNTVEALWGTYDCSAAGILGMLRGVAKVRFENCHVAAKLDVHNDCCANYQYYQYRYSGMFIGSVRAHFNGGSVPDIRNIYAENCTYSIGDWNRYWYCELVANSLASYTHDHQFSRLTEIDSILDISNDDGETFTKTGNFVIANAYVMDNGLTVSGNAIECYHIMKAADGSFFRHYHDRPDPGAAADSIYETATGVTGDSNGYKDGKLLKEDRQRYFIPFNQLLTGYGWGATAVTESNIEAICKEQGKAVSELGFERKENGASVQKFSAHRDSVSLTENLTVKVGDLFKVKDSVDPALIASATTKVFVSSDKNATINVVHNSAADWKDGTLTFSGQGTAKLVITDYNYCIPTVMYISIGDTADMFQIALPNYQTYLYRVGNLNQVPVGKLFEQSVDYVSTIDSSKVTVEVIAGNGIWTANANDWEQSTIDFSGYTGLAKVAIGYNEGPVNQVVLNLEVVNAENATTEAKSATGCNVVLLDDFSFGTLSVSNGYSLYGNGFTLSCSTDAVAKDMGSAFVELNNGVLDNVQIKCPNFSHAILYSSNYTENNNPSDGAGRYYNMRSAVIMKGNSKILNSYISGGRAAVYASAGTLEIANTTIEGGAAANIHVASPYSLTLRDITCIQEPKQATVNDKTKILMGLSVVVICDADGYSSPITLEGTLRQYAWACEEYKEYVPEKGKSFVSVVLGKKDYVHSVTYADGVTRDSLNLGILFMPSGLTAPKEPIDNKMIIDNRTDKNSMPYNSTDINSSAYVYSYLKSNGTALDTTIKPQYSATTQTASAPMMVFSEVNEYRTFETVYDEIKGWTSTLRVDVDQGAYVFNFANLLAQKYGKNLQYTVNTAGGTAVDKNASITLNDSYTAEYTLTIADPLAHDGNGNLIDGMSVNHKHTFVLIATRTSLPAPQWYSQALSSSAKHYAVATSRDGDWNVAVSVLDGISAKYWSKASGGSKTVEFANITVNGSGTLSETNSYTISVPDEYTLTVKTSGFKSNPVDDGKPIAVGNKLYFTVAKSSNFVSTGTTEREITITYTFTDANNSDPIEFSIKHKLYYSDLKNAQKSYNDFCKGEIKDATNCVTPDTLITLADGTKKRVDALTGKENLLVWNLQTGKLDSAPIMFVDSEAETECEVIHLHFSDGTEVKVIYEHGFWDYDLNKYVYLDRNAADYIGHSFAKQSGNGLEKVTLVDVVLETETTTAWSPVTAEHLCYFTEGMLSMPGGVGGLFNIFEVDAETMTYDYAAMERDLATYGLFTYEEMAMLAPGLSRDMFEAAGGAYLKVSIGKGNLTEEELVNMITRYSKYFG